MVGETQGTPRGPDSSEVTITSETQPSSFANRDHETPGPMETSYQGPSQW